MTPRLTKRSKPVRLLRTKFENGDITGKEDPKTVWESDDVFRCCDLTNFRTCYNNMRKEFDTTAKKDDLNLNRKATISSQDNMAKRRRTIETGGAEEEIDENEIEENKQYGVELTMDTTYFEPIYSISRWTEPGVMTKRLTVAVLLPSGVGRGDFSYRVVDEGNVLEFIVTWPDVMTDVLLLHKKWLYRDDQYALQRYHPKILGFEEALKEYRDRCQDKIESKTRIVLPFAVQAGIVAKSNLAWKCNSALVCYVELKAATEEYAIVNDEDDFEET